MQLSKNLRKPARQKEEIFVVCYIMQKEQSISVQTQNKGFLIMIERELFYQILHYEQSQKSAWIIQHRKNKRL